MTTQLVTRPSPRGRTGARRIGDPPHLASRRSTPVPLPRRGTPRFGNSGGIWPQRKALFTWFVPADRSSPAPPYGAPYFGTTPENPRRGGIQDIKKRRY